MSWAWRSCEGRKCAAVVFASSVNPVAAEGYRFSDSTHAAVVAAFRGTVAKMRAMPCDILITAHPDQSGGNPAFAVLQRRRVPNPFIDPGSCRRYADRSQRKLDACMAQENGAPPLIRTKKRPADRSAGRWDRYVLAISPCR